MTVYEFAHARRKSGPGHHAELEPKAAQDAADAQLQIEVNRAGIPGGSNS